MGWIVLAISLVSSFLAYRATQNIPKANNEAEPKAPIIEEGRVIGVVFGRVKVTSPQIYWWGDLKGVEIRK